MAAGHLGLLLDRRPDHLEVHLEVHLDHLQGRHLQGCHPGRHGHRHQCQCQAEVALPTSHRLLRRTSLAMAAVPLRHQAPRQQLWLWHRRLWDLALRLGAGPLNTQALHP